MQQYFRINSYSAYFSCRFRAVSAFVLRQMRPTIQQSKFYAAALQILNIDISVYRYISVKRVR